MKVNVYSVQRYVLNILFPNMEVHLGYNLSNSLAGIYILIDKEKMYGNIIYYRKTCI